MLYKTSTKDRPYCVGLPAADYLVSLFCVMLPLRLFVMQNKHNETQKQKHKMSYAFVKARVRQKLHKSNEICAPLGAAWSILGAILARAGLDPKVGPKIQFLGIIL